MATLQGTVDRITYQNDDNGFTVFRVQPGDGRGAIACVGTTPTIEPGQTVVLNGSLERHKRFGTQFAVQSYEIVRPTTPEGIVRLLSSGFIAALGASRARAIVDRFGAETLDIFDNEPRRLLEVPGIGPKILARIREAWDAQRHLRALILFLQDFGVTLSAAYKIYKAYGVEAQARVSANPYALIEDVWGVGFKRADAIAQKLGFTRDSYKRIQAGLTFMLQEAMGEGHCYLPAAELQRRAAEILEVDESLVIYSLYHAVLARAFEREEERVYLPALFHAERVVGELLHERTAQPIAGIDTAAIRRWFEQHAAAHGVHLDGKQLDACVGAVRHPAFVLTGGPGTGKTTTLQVLVAYFQSRNARVALAAPTGRAAQRMGSVAGTKAQTIHRLLEFRPQSNGPPFARNASNQLEVDVVVVDEVSMVDILLMRSLLEALPPAARLVLVGDSHQLPSIGPGAVLADLIGSGSVSHVELTTVFRQAAQSRIVTCAHQVRRGEMCHFENARTDNCFFLRQEEPEQALETVVTLVCDRLPRRYNLDPRSDIQVLTPMHRGPLGTRNINRILQERLSTGGRSVTRGDITYTTGDRVMQIRNNYDRGVFNGDIGSIVDIGGDDELSVDFGGERAVYSLRELDEITHAYCISIHKSQGCEFKAVVIPMSTQHFVMLKRNLVYTALTRARELCVFVGSRRALGIAVRAEDGLRRYTWLARRIRGGTQIES
ncbi:MAG: ATP-dependent RecD-like DNA helicase [Chitinivibrionales bacterium]|nr:ATP-dependent RecD-like DNA helicase [Chitinivibrionales bacterium]